MGVDLFFYKTVEQKYPGHPRRVEQRMYKEGFKLFRLDREDIAGLTPLFARFTCYDWPKTFSKRGLKLEDYRVAGFSSSDKGMFHEFVFANREEPHIVHDSATGVTSGYDLVLEDCEVKRCMRSLPYVWTQEVFYGRLGYCGGEGYMDFFSRHVGDAPEMSLAEFKEKVLPPLREKFPKVWRVWNAAAKKHANETDLVYVSY